MAGNYRHHFKDVPSEELCLLYDPAVYHQVVSEHRGPKSMMLINPGNDWIEEYTENDIGQVRIGPSIANTAFDLACKLGADPIIFVGQDLAFTNDATHAEGTHLRGVRGFDYSISNPVHKLSEATDSPEKQSLRRLKWVEGPDGDKVQTDSKMLSYLHWFEERVHELGDTRTVINATEGGALIRGTKVLTLEETLRRFCQEDISISIQNIHRLLTQRPEYNLSRFVAYIKTVKRCAKTLASQCKKGARLSKALREHHKGNKTCNQASALQKLTRIDQMLVQEESNYRPLHYLTAPIIGLLSGQAKKTDDQAEACHYSYLLYRELHQAFSRSLPLLGELIKSLDHQPPVVGVESGAGLQVNQMRDVYESERRENQVY
jgi:hypothetical protein